MTHEPLPVWLQIWLVAGAVQALVFIVVLWRRR